MTLFKFDFGANCSQGAVNTKAVCKRLSGALNLAMGGGKDLVQVGSSGATSVSANLGTFDDTYIGIGGPDNIFASDGDDDVNTGGGNDDIRIGNGADKADAGSGDDEVTVGASTNSAGHDVVEGGPGADHIELHQEGNPFGRKTVSGGSGNDFVRTDDGIDIVDGGSGVDDIGTRGGDDEIFVKESDLEKAAAADTVKCGFDHDEVTADLKDVVDAISNPGGGTCEEVDRSPIGETPHVRILSKTLRVLPTGRVRVRLRCPRRSQEAGLQRPAAATGRPHPEGRRTGEPLAEGALPDQGRQAQDGDPKADTQGRPHTSAPEAPEGQVPGDPRQRREGAQGPQDDRPQPATAAAMRIAGTGAR